VAVGTVEPRKNLGMLIAGHAAARRQRIDVPPLVLIGGPGWGAPFGGVQPDAADVSMVGYLSDERLRAVVAGADALCMPSRYEGFGLPLLETLAAGRPVLASDIAAHREVGADAAQYVAMDTSAWAEAITGLATHGPQTSVAQRRARATAFTWRRSAQAHLQTYRDAIDS
jgi:glycosyltransferase involved in cell wall biosynthesis